MINYLRYMMLNSNTERNIVKEIAMIIVVAMHITKYNHYRYNEHKITTLILFYV